jgi:phospholipid transport system transporter-binding protein
VADPAAPSGGAAAAPAVVLALPSVLTQHEARDCLQALRSRMPAAGATSPIQIDAAPLERFDSSALAVLLACRRAAPAGFAVRSVPPRLAGLARLYGVAALLGIDAAAAPGGGACHAGPASVH